MRACHPPIAIDRVLPDPGLLRRLVEQHQPYLPVQRYFQNDAEYEAISGGRTPIIAPNFRGDWAYDRPLVEGVEPFLFHEGFTQAARQIFGGGVVRPQQVYANLTWQLPFTQGAGHTDVPSFRGVDRRTTSTSLLTVMCHSGLFERWQVPIATAVAWFYEGEDGGFQYWPDGPERPSRIHEGAIFNTAFVGDNDFMFHRVRPVGRREDGLPRGLTLKTELRRVDGSLWEVRDGEALIGEFDYPALRISVSWKAMVFRDDEDARRFDREEDALNHDQAFELFYADLASRGVDFQRPSDPLRDPDLYRVLAATYLEAPPTAGVD